LQLSGRPGGGPVFDPSVFDVSDIEAAKRIILTPEDSSTTERWAKETPYIGELMARHLGLTPDGILLDYGCGIGRLAREAIARFNCRVLGVDLSPSMRALAATHVASERFSACAASFLERLVRQGLLCDAALAVWVLQHGPDPAADIALIASALRPGGRLLVLNNLRRAVPTQGGGWRDDGVDVWRLLAERFDREESGAPDPAATTPLVVRFARWAVFRRR